MRRHCSIQTRSPHYYVKRRLQMNRSYRPEAGKVSVRVRSSHMTLGKLCLFDPEGICRSRAGSQVGNGCLDWGRQRSVSFRLQPCLLLPFRSRPLCHRSSRFRRHPRTRPSACGHANENLAVSERVTTKGCYPQLLGRRHPAMQFRMLCCPVSNDPDPAKDALVQAYDSGGRQLEGSASDWFEQR